MVSPLKCLNNSNICRLCLESKPNLIHIFNDNDSNDDNIANRIMSCVSVLVTYNDDGPQKICHECMDSVNSWVKFKRNCDTTSSFLKTQLSPSKSTKSDKEVCSSLLLQRDLDSLLSNELFPTTTAVHSEIEMMITQPARPSSTISSILNFHIDEIQKKRLSKQNDHQLDNESGEDTNASSIWNLCLNNNDVVKSPVNENPYLRSSSCSADNNTDNLSSENQNNGDVRFLNASRYVRVELEEHNYSDNIINNNNNYNIDDNNNTNVVTISNRPKFKIKTKKGYTCEICKGVYKKFSDLLSHDLTVHESLEKNVVCPVCGQLFLTETRLEVHAVKHVEKTFECQICGKMYVNQKSLYSHRAIHRSRYRCDVCAYVATSDRLLIEHRCARHGQENHRSEFQCSTCYQRFSTSWSLSRHTKNRHENVRNSYKCSVCSAIFTRYDDLKTHANLHDDVNSNSNSNNNNNNNNNLICDICGLCYKSRRSLKNHIRKHAPARFQCSTCQKSFYTAFELSTHSQTHSNIKGFFCSICRRSFSYKVTLKRHIFSKCDPTLKNKLKGRNVKI